MKRARGLQVGEVFALESSFGSFYVVVDTADPDDWSDCNYVLQNIHSGWKFTAHGVNIHEGGCIDWDFSTNGRFEDVILVKEV